MNRIPRVAAPVALLAATLALTTAAPASAAEPPPDFEAAQVGLTYSVYGPTNTLGMPMKRFKLMSCGAGNDDQVWSQFKKSKNVWIELLESKKGCQDGPWPIIVVKEFKVHGADALLYADCPGSEATCAADDVNVKRDGGYLLVTLPSGGDGLSRTKVEMYTMGVSASGVKSFARGLEFVG